MVNTHRRSFVSSSLSSDLDVNVVQGAQTGDATEKRGEGGRLIGTKLFREDSAFL